MNCGMRFMTLYTRRDQDHPHGKEMQKSKMAVWVGLTNSCEKKRSEKQGEKERYKHLNAEFQKNISFRFIDYGKAFDCVDHKKLWKILKEMGIPDHLACLLRNLYAGQEATVRTRWNRLVPNRKRSMSRLYIVTLLI